jgi:hypothetical protein
VCIIIAGACCVVGGLTLSIGTCVGETFRLVDHFLPRAAWNMVTRLVNDTFGVIGGPLAAIGTRIQRYSTVYAQAGLVTGLGYSLIALLYSVSGGDFVTEDETKAWNRTREALRLRRPGGRLQSL